MLGLTLALYSHAAFFIYALIYLCLEALYFRESRSGTARGHGGSLVAGRGAAAALGIAAISDLRQLQQHGLRSWRAGEFAAASLARSSITSRSLRFRIAGSNRLPERGQHLAARDSGCCI